MQTLPSDAPYAVNLGPDAARELAESGAALLLLNVPPGSYFGLDQQAFLVGPKFKGVKMLPPGPHFVACHAIGRQGEFIPTVGFFVCLEPRQARALCGLRSEL